MEEDRMLVLLLSALVLDDSVFMVLTLWSCAENDRKYFVCKIITVDIPRTY